MYVVLYILNYFILVDFIRAFSYITYKMSVCENVKISAMNIKMAMFHFVIIIKTVWALSIDEGMMMIIFLTSPPAT